MTGRLIVPDSQLDSPLGKVSPVVKLAVAFAWLVGLAFTLDPRPPLILATVGIGVSLLAGRVSLGGFGRGAAPLFLAATGVGVFNAVFSGSNSDLSAPVWLQLGPIRVVDAAALAGIGLFARVVAIATTAVAFAQTTDSTRLVDSLVRQALVPARFGYGALAAYQAVPRLAGDLSSLRASRRIRGLRGSWHPRLLVGLLVRAIRHGDALAIAMDARAFGPGERTWYRELHWTLRDALAGIAGILILIAALAIPG